jgi:hypothetical protein
MYRNILTNLLQWKQNSLRKPLILNGTRQVGKTWILKEFGSREFSASHHFDFDKNAKQLNPIFDHDLNPTEILRNLSLLIGKKIDPVTDLIIFDEIQNCPRALTSLKYFCEDLPGLRLCAAGSLLGVSLSRESFPVGKVDMLHLYPMNFEEFLAAGENPLLLDCLKTAFDGKTVPPRPMKNFPGY